MPDHIRILVRNMRKMEEVGHKSPSSMADEIKRLRSALERIIRDAERAKKSNWITRADAIEHIMRLARYAEDAINPPNAPDQRGA
jgi:hypothetical protein